MKRILDVCSYDASVLVRRELLRTLVKFIYCPLHTYYILELLYSKSEKINDNTITIQGDRTEEDIEGYSYIVDKYNELKNCKAHFDLHSSYITLDNALYRKYDLSHRVTTKMHKENTSVRLQSITDTVKLSLKPVTSESQIYRQPPRMLQNSRLHPKFNLPKEPPSVSIKPVSRQQSEPVFESERRSELLQSLNDFHIPSTLFEVYYIYLVLF